VKNWTGSCPARKSSCNSRDRMPPPIPLTGQEEKLNDNRFHAASHRGRQYSSRTTQAERVPHQPDHGYLNAGNLCHQYYFHHSTALQFRGHHFDRRDYCRGSISAYLASKRRSETGIKLLITTILIGSLTSPFITMDKQPLSRSLLPSSHP